MTMTCAEVKELLGRKEKVNLGFYPTPFYKLENMSRLLGINLYIKREDFSGQSLFGGNKIRKLEYLIGDAKKQGAEYVFTYGATQSNHAMQTAEACRKEGLKPVLYLRAVVEPDENDVRSNLLLDKILGAEVHIVRKTTGESNAEFMERTRGLGREQMERLEAEGHRCYNVPGGGASPIGSCGFIGGFVELTEQLEQAGIHADYLFHATGTGGTTVGLHIGKRLLDSGIEIVPIEVSDHGPLYRQQCAELAMKTLECIGVEGQFTADDFHTDATYWQPGYEMPSAGGTEAIRMLAQNEGLFADPVYSGKALAGLIDYVRSGRVPQGSNVVFLHTGGATALFAEKEILGELF